ncbi:MAG: MarR family transcriptional regulator [Desulfobacterales bacterium]|nr:MarR family transcriptional regulator [Desulfobacterales bacterium]
MARGDYINDLTPDEKMVIAIVRVSESLKKKYTVLLENYGLTFPQYTVLRALKSSFNGENTLTNIRKIMLVSGANMTGIARRLEKKGFILRRPDPHDDRIKLLQITPKALQTLKNVMDDKNKFLVDALSDLTEGSKAEVKSHLRQVMKRLKTSP